MYEPRFLVALRHVVQQPIEPPRDGWGCLATAFFGNIPPISDICARAFRQSLKLQPFAQMTTPYPRVVDVQFRGMNFRQNREHALNGLFGEYSVTRKNTAEVSTLGAPRDEEASTQQRRVILYPKWLRDR